MHNKSTGSKFFAFSTGTQYFDSIKFKLFAKDCVFPVFELYTIPIIKYILSTNIDYAMHNTLHLFPYQCHGHFHKLQTYSVEIVK